MSTATTAGVLLVILPVAFNAAFAGLAARFDYPDILRRPTDEVLARFRAGGSGLVMLWWAFALTAVALAPTAVMLSESLDGADNSLRALGTTAGVLAALVQFPPAWLGVVGIVIGALLVLCSLEFVGRFERTGWKLAATLTPITYIAWSVWLVATGVALLL